MGMDDPMTPEPRQRTTTPSPLAAALAEAVIEQRAKRAGLVPVVVANVVDVTTDRLNPAHPQAREASSRLRDHGLQVVEGGRRAQTEP
jgi:hypothetical protein